MAKAKWISVSEDGAVWCVGTDGFLYKRVGEGWVMNGHVSQVEQVAVGWEVEVWCINSNGGLFKGDEPRDVYAKFTRINNIPKLRSISSGHDGSFWAVTRDGALLKREGPPYNPDINYIKLVEPHTPVDDAILVSTGGEGKVVYVNKDGVLFEEYVVNRETGHKAWKPMEPPQIDGTDRPIKSISWSRQGVIWAADKDDLLHKRQASSPHNWKENKYGMAVQISTGGRNSDYYANPLVWCINRDGDIYRARNEQYDTKWINVPLTQITPSTGASFYTVKKDDTVSGIIVEKCPNISSAKLEEKIEEVGRINGLDNVDLIYPGQTLAIPACP